MHIGDNHYQVQTTPEVSQLAKTAVNQIPKAASGWKTAALVGIGIAAGPLVAQVAKPLLDLYMPGTPEVTKPVEGTEVPKTGLDFSDTDTRYRFNVEVGE